MRIAQEEICGPVLVIIPFETEEEAIDIANDTPYGLAAYLQTGDASKAERVASQLRAGAIHINGGGFNYGSPLAAINNLEMVVRVAHWVSRIFKKLKLYIFRHLFTPIIY